MTPLETKLLEVIKVMSENLLGIDYSLDRLQERLHALEEAQHASNMENINGHNHIANMVSHLDLPRTKPIPDTKEKSTPEGRAQKAVAKLEGLFDITDVANKCPYRADVCNSDDCREHARRTIPG